jgi:hypothetical protein
MPLLKALATGQLVAALSAGATSALLVVLAQDRLGGGSGFGVLVAAIGAGAALGHLLLLRRINDPRRPLFVFGPYAVRCVVDLVLAVATSVPLAAGALLFYGLSTSTGNVPLTWCDQATWRPKRGHARAGRPEAVRPVPTCGCCGRERRRLSELGSTSGVFTAGCARCRRGGARPAAHGHPSG